MSDFQSVGPTTLASRYPAPTRISGSLFHPISPVCLISPIYPILSNRSHSSHLTIRPHSSQLVPSAHHPRTDKKASAGGFPPPADATQKKAASYSPASHRSTIGAGGLNFSVRNGKRWDPAAITTKYVLNIRFQHTGTRQAEQEGNPRGLPRNRNGETIPRQEKISGN